SERRAAAGTAQHAYIGVAEFAQRGLGIAGGIEIEGGLALFDLLLLEDRLEQAVLVGEVDIKGTLGDGAGAGDLAHAGAVKAKVHEHLARAVENLAALGAFLFAGSRMRIWTRCNHWFRFWKRFRHCEGLGRGFGPMFHTVRWYLDRTVRSMVI